MNLSSPLLGQGGVLVGSGYRAPSTLMVSPGEILPLEVIGLRPISPSSIQAPSTPLPTSLAGISVTFNQAVQTYLGFPSTSLPSLQAPIVSIRQSSVCSPVSAPACLVTIITIQVPYELLHIDVGLPYFFTAVVVSQAGVDSSAFSVAVVDDQIHVVTTCDQAENVSCQSIVTHLDGTLVTAQSPAKPSETVVLYGWGFGSTYPMVKTGEITPSPAPVLANGGGIPSGAIVGFDFTPNAGPARLAGLPSQLTATAYLTPGQVGLYQTDVQLPASFPTVVACGGPVSSNLTISLSGSWSTDGASICVQAAQ